MASNKPKVSSTMMFFLICVFFGFVALFWELKHRFRFKMLVKPDKFDNEKLISVLDDFIKLKNCSDPFIENFQEKHGEFKEINRLWIINSADYWTVKILKIIKKRGVVYNLSPFLPEEQVRAVKREIRLRIRKNGFLYELNALLGGFFGVFLEVRSLEFFLAWGRATQKPVTGKLFKKMFVWFSSYFTGVVIPCAVAVDELHPVILPYDHIYEMVKRAKIARLQPCSCKAYFLPGEEVPRDSCMGFEYIEDLDDLADEGYHADFQMRDHVLKKLQECEDKGLIHQFMTVSRPTGKKGYVLCNCGESCIPVFLYTRYGIPMVRGSGLKVEISLSHGEKCPGCGTCVKRCIFKAAEVVNGNALINEEKCLGCGVCVKSCPAGIRGLSSIQYSKSS